MQFKEFNPRRIFRRQEREKPESSAAKAARISRETERKERPDKFPNRIAVVDQGLELAEWGEIANGDTSAISAAAIHTVRGDLRGFESKFRREIDEKVGKKDGIEREQTIWTVINEKTQDLNGKPIAYELPCKLDGTPEEIEFLVFSMENMLDTTSPGVYVGSKENNENKENRQSFYISLGRRALRELYSAQSLPPLDQPPS